MCILCDGLIPGAVEYSLDGVVEQVVVVRGFRQLCCYGGGGQNFRFSEVLILHETWKYENKFEYGMKCCPYFPWQTM